jgi:hypothetical protein
VEEAKALIKDLESKMDEKQLAEAKKYLEDVKSGKVAEKKEEPKTDEP